MLFRFEVNDNWDAAALWHEGHFMHAMTKEQWMARPHHHANDGRAIGRRVFCDGVEVEDVAEANTEQGWYRTVVKGASGRILLDKVRGEIITMTVRGKIEIVYPE